jgi:hypothetical protein
MTGKPIGKEIKEMIDPRTQYIIYKEQETELMLQIERKLAAQERGGFAETSQPWYFAAKKWLKEKVFSHMSAKRQSTFAESTRKDSNEYI